MQRRIQSAQIPRYFTMKRWARGKIKAEGLSDQPTQYRRDWHDARVHVGRKTEDAIGVQVVRQADFTAMLWRPASMTKTMTTCYILANRPESGFATHVNIGRAIHVPPALKVK